MTPEELARQSIDRQLESCGWLVQDRKAMNIYAALGVAVRKFTLDDGEADCLLYANGNVIGVTEAKSAEHGTLTGVERQSVNYVSSLPAGVPSYRLPVPFHYETNGTRSPTCSTHRHAVESCLIPPSEFLRNRN
jgi:type I restriction enzyme R subunit